MAKASRPLEWLGYQSSGEQTSDIRSLSMAELEELAGSTAVTIIKAAHQREREAESRSQELLNTSMMEADRVRREAEETASTTLSSAQKSATSLIESANASAEATLKNAERQSAKLIAEAKKEAEELLAKANAEILRTRADLDKTVKNTTAQLNAAVTKVNTGLQAQLQQLRAVALKTNEIETELTAAREATSALLPLFSASQPDNANS